MTTTSKILLGVLGAAAAGIAIGMLIAPDSGTDTRRKIAGNTRDLFSEFKDWLGKRQKNLGEIRKTASRRAEDFSDIIDTEWDTPRTAIR